MSGGFDVALTIPSGTLPCSRRSESLVDFRSRVRAMSGWGWQYWTGRRTARLITGIGTSADRGVD